MNQPAFIWQVPATTAAVTASDSLAGTSPAWLLEGIEDAWWRPADQSGTTTLTIDLGSAQAVDCVALVGQDLDGVTLTVSASTDNFATSDDELAAAAALSGDFNAWRSFTGGTYRYWRLEFAGMSSAFGITHVCLDGLRLLPWLADGYDNDSLETDAVDMVSLTGLYLGNSQSRAMWTQRLDFGTVTAAELAVFLDWRDDCLVTKRPFFFVPDTAAAACRFVWTEKGYSFSAPQRTGLHDLGAIPITGRAR